MKQKEDMSSGSGKIENRTIDDRREVRLVRSICTS